MPLLSSVRSDCPSLRRHPTLPGGIGVFSGHLDKTLCLHRRYTGANMHSSNDVALDCASCSPSESSAPASSSGPQIRWWLPIPGTGRHCPLHTSVLQTQSAVDCLRQAGSGPDAWLWSIQALNKASDEITSEACASLKDFFEKSMVFPL